MHTETVFHSNSQGNCGPSSRKQLMTANGLLATQLKVLCVLLLSSLQVTLKGAKNRIKYINHHVFSIKLTNTKTYNKICILSVVLTLL